MLLKYAENQKQAMRDTILILQILGKFKRAEETHTNAFVQETTGSRSGLCAEVNWYRNIASLGLGNRLLSSRGQGLHASHAGQG